MSWKPGKESLKKVINVLQLCSPRKVEFFSIKVIGSLSIVSVGLGGICDRRGNKGEFFFFF